MKAVEERVNGIPIPVVLFIDLFVDHFSPPNLPNYTCRERMCVESIKPRILYKRQFKLAGGPPALWGGGSGLDGVASRSLRSKSTTTGREGLMAACTMCSEEIAEPRQIVAPHTLTCSPACARERDLWRKRQAARRQRQRQKAARAAAREVAG